jgi:hypothetical protein
MHESLPMTPLEIKKRIIKDLIKPFFKNNGFSNKGVKYSKHVNHLHIQADIQSLRYHKKDNTEEFRINIKIYPEDSRLLTFGAFFIPSHSSHITIDEHSNIEQLQVNINRDLNNLAKLFAKYNDVAKIIKEQTEAIKFLQAAITEKKNQLQAETSNQNLIAILKNTIALYENQIKAINDWIKTAGA